MLRHRLCVDTSLTIIFCTVPESQTPANIDYTLGYVSLSKAGTSTQECMNVMSVDILSYALTHVLFDQELSSD